MGLDDCNKITSDAILLVFASDYYDATCYICNYEEVINLVGAHQKL